MFINEELKDHLQTSSSVKINSLVLAEWNMNTPDNIYKIGNYRHRPLEDSSVYKSITSNFDNQDLNNSYTNATDADIVIDGGYDDEDVPQTFLSKKDKMKMIYSLEDCLNPFRPRSGINKPLYFGGKFLANSGSRLAERPRYYMPSRNDQFKYWTSYRTEDNKERGIAKNKSNGLFFIDDAAPFVVYKEKLPANRIVVKMQTNVGKVDLGPFTTITGSIQDPLYGESNKTVPKKWKIQTLSGNNWVDAYNFNDGDTKENGLPIIGSDGYVELQYGLIVPDIYKDIFIFAEELSSETLLPSESIEGYTYLVINNEGENGLFHIWTEGEYKTFVPKYGWKIGSDDITNNTNFVSDLTNPKSFTDTLTSSTTYREFDYIRGIRIVCYTMNKFDSTFDLIEMSPRLVADISDRVTSFKVTKILSDLGITSMPVGQLLASTGDINLFDYDQAFNEENENSIVNKYIRKNIKFNFYEKILDVNGNDYYVPIKTLYSEGFPQADFTGSTISITLRDMFFFLESMPAPRMLTTETSLSYAVSLLLDYIGFSNYSFKTVNGESEAIIPYFFVAPDQNVAQVLNQLAIATQTSMFFDEYNNFIVMSKDYLMPDVADRETDFVLSGSNNQTDTGVVGNSSSGYLPNILAIASEDKKIYNDGKINYTERYIQRSYGSIRQSTLVDKEKTWIYKPSLLWEVSGTDATKTINEVANKQGSYVLGAMPLNSNLANVAPTVEKNVVINNIMDLGENIYWLTRYNGYFYSNGEIIKYDAVQFNITLPIWYPVKTDGSIDESKPMPVLPGRTAPTGYRQGSSNIWITSNQEYQKYFSQLPFNGKIYPTGLVRIFSEPYYETVAGVTRLKNGAVSEHGRAQFGTTIASHFAGVGEYWSNNDYVRGFNMESEYLYTTNLLGNISYPATELGLAGSDNVLARQTSRSGIIKNFMATNYLTETQVNNLKTTQSGTVQSSALVMNGPSFTTSQKPINFLSYVYKQLDDSYKHFGTRMRIIGTVNNDVNETQAPIGSTPYYQATSSTTNQNTNIGGSSGGIAFLLNPATNNGYYFEIAALTEKNITSYLNLDSSGQSNIAINNVLFYKVKKENNGTKAIPIKLWGGLTSVLVDDGKFTGQYRVSGESNPTVYDLAVEYQDIGTTRRFFLYINNKLIQIVDDPDPLPKYNNIALFTRGSSKCMYENVYALTDNYSQNTVFTVGETLSSAFGDTEINANESFSKYAMSGVIQSTYLSGVSAQQPPRYKMYFEEFGTIMRECAYFDIKYDRAFPALYAKLSPVLNRIKGYAVSGFTADSYGAEFLIFNATDKALSLDETTGNFLRIQGITFTQDTTYQLSVDEYFNKRGNFSTPELKGSELVYAPFIEQEKYDKIKQSRMIYGKNEFSIDSQYIQTEDDAKSLMGWIINKVMLPKKSVGINLFAIPTIQLGDIVTIDYKNEDGINLVSSDNSRFVVYNMEYARNSEGPSMTLYLSEV